MNPGQNDTNNNMTKQNIFFNQTFEQIFYEIGYFVKLFSIVSLDFTNE